MESGRLAAEALLQELGITLKPREPGPVEPKAPVITGKGVGQGEHAGEQEADD
jgi:hypothetical protein